MPGNTATGNQPDTQQGQQGQQPGTIQQGTPQTGSQQPAQQSATLPQAPQGLQAPPTSQSLREQNPNLDLDRQWNHLRGEVMARANEWETWRGQAEQVNRSLSSELGQVRSQYEQAQQQLSQAQEQLEQAQTWQEQAQRAQQIEVQNDRLRRLIRYPQILAQTTQQQQPQIDENGQPVVGENGQPVMQTVQVNPYLDVLMNSTLQGDQFEAAVRNMAQSLGGQNVPGTQQQNPQPQQPQQPQQSPQPQQQWNAGMGSFMQANQVQAPTTVTTPPPQPQETVEQRIQTLEQQAWEARDEGRYEDMRTLDLELMQLKQQQGQR